MKKFTIAFALLLGAVPTLVPACTNSEAAGPRDLGISTVERAYHGGEKVLIGRNSDGQEVTRMNLTVTDNELQVSVDFVDDLGEPGHLDIAIDDQGKARALGATSTAEIDWAGPVEELGNIEDDGSFAEATANWQAVLAASPQSLSGHVNDKREFRVSCSTVCHVASIVGCLSGGPFAWICELIMVVECELICSAIDS